MKLIFTFAALLFMYGQSTGQDLAGIKCIVNGEHAASAEASIEYKEGKVYFCCDSCVSTFKEEMGKEENSYATKANHQLVLTGQYVQKGCPVSGRETSKDHVTKVGGVEVAFCCGGCAAKINKADDLEAKAQLVFAKGPFEKAFEAKTEKVSLDGIKCMMMPGRGVKEKFSAEYGVGKVYFCCKGCQGKFAKDPEKFATKANYQLVATGQVEQVACPFSAQDVDDDQVAEVGDVKIKLCCGNCKTKLDQADADKKMELVFGKKGFAKAFSAGK
jgi:YHS domain-containing protein